MKADEIINSEEFKKIIEFHGHVCPGVAIGYRAAKTALERLAASRSEDAELVAIVENDACGVDAVQVLTGCTFGKGNFFYRDYGKHVFTFICRNTGNAVRISMKSDALSGGGVNKEIFDRVSAGEASEEEIALCRNSRKSKLEKVLTMPAEDLFTIKTLNMNPPSRAVVMASEPCSACGEATMPTKFEIVNGKNICRSCATENS